MNPRNQIIFRLCIHVHSWLIPKLEYTYIHKRLQQLTMTTHGQLQLHLKPCKALSGRTNWPSVQCRKSQFFEPVLFLFLKKKSGSPMLIKVEAMRQARCKDTATKDGLPHISALVRVPGLRKGEQMRRILDE